MTLRPKAPEKMPPSSSAQLPRGLGSGSATSGLHGAPTSRRTSLTNTSAAESTTRLQVFSKRSNLRTTGGFDINGKTSKLLLQVRLETSPQLLQQVGDFVGAYAKYRFQPRTAERIALASYELIENAVSYGSVSGDVVYQLSENDRWMEISVANESSAGRLANLRTQLDRLRVDAEKVFLDEMGKSMTASGGRAAIGLARICHEGQMDLEFELEGSRVTMRARCAR